ncbi:ankyrin repeat domain-containing protein [Streptomyces sp. NPDC100445]|uniref:ankyrin repeat domain-containing protein n=1 Tax=Streptomyces sp. NPDC100445 TaxID=3366102 RepID=UPI0037F5AD5F
MVSCRVPVTRVRLRIPLGPKPGRAGRDPEAGAGEPRADRPAARACCTSAGPGRAAPWASAAPSCPARSRGRVCGLARSRANPRGRDPRQIGGAGVHGPPRRRDGGGVVGPVCEGGRCAARCRRAGRGRRHGDGTRGRLGGRPRLGGLAGPPGHPAAARPGADPEALPCGERPLHRAVAFGSPEVVAELAGRVADVDALQDGTTALWEAVVGHRPQIARVLVAAGADPWRPVLASGSPGRLSLAGPTPDLFPLRLPERPCPLPVRPWPLALPSAAMSLTFLGCRSEAPLCA